MGESSINVCFGQDSINDPWNPVVNGKTMNIWDTGIHLPHMMSFDDLDRCFDPITDNGGTTLVMEEPYGIDVGKLANFLVLAADSSFETMLASVAADLVPGGRSAAGGASRRHRQLYTWRPTVKVTTRATPYAGDQTKEARHVDPIPSHFSLQ